MLKIKEVVTTCAIIIKLVAVAIAESINVIAIIFVSPLTA